MFDFTFGAGISKSDDLFVWSLSNRTIYSARRHESILTIFKWNRRSSADKPMWIRRWASDISLAVTKSKIGLQIKAQRLFLTSKQDFNCLRTACNCNFIEMTKPNNEFNEELQVNLTWLYYRKMEIYRVILLVLELEKYLRKKNMSI